MKISELQFLGPENEFAQWETAKFALLPIPYEGAVSYGRGAAAAPEAVLKASCFLEFYDEVLKFQPHEAGIITLAPPPISDDHAVMHQTIYEHTREIINAGKMPVILGGDHSISSGVFRALKEKYGQLSCIQIDAHSDLRDAYEGSIYSHASVMARIREMTPHTLQLGIRSMSFEEAKTIARDGLPVCTMYDYRRGLYSLDEALKALPDPVFLTFDVDAFDWSVIACTGTPEPGGFTWNEAMILLWKIFERKHVVGFDVVELAADPHDRNSPFAVAKLIYKMIGFSAFSAVQSA
jgi:agmatinase